MTYKRHLAAGVRLTPELARDSSFDPNDWVLDEMKQQLKLKGFDEAMADCPPGTSGIIAVVGHFYIVPYEELRGYKEEDLAEEDE